MITPEEVPSQFCMSRNDGNIVVVFNIIFHSSSIVYTIKIRFFVLIKIVILMHFDSYLTCLFILINIPYPSKPLSCYFS